MSSLEEQAWLGSPGQGRKYVALPRFRQDIVKGSYVKVAFKETGPVIGRVAYKGDINDEVPMNRFVTIYFPSDETFWDFNMWGREGKAIYKIPDPPLSEQFEIPEDASIKESPEGEAGGGGEEGEVAGGGEEGEVVDEGEECETLNDEELTSQHAIAEGIEEAARAAPRRRRRRRSTNFTHKKKRRVNTQ